jgi:hypothetical protein
LSYEEWSAIGRTLTQVAGAALWLIGDWLAFGQKQYHGLDGFKRMENERYSVVARDTGFAEGTLRNAKYICSAVNLSRRRDKLTFTHAQEIVGRAAPAQFDYWIDLVNKSDLTVKQLREALRKSKATYKSEPNDGGELTPLAITDQYCRDILVLVPNFTPTQKREHLKNLEPVLRALSAGL